MSGARGVRDGRAAAAAAAPLPVIGARPAASRVSGGAAVGRALGGSAGGGGGGSVVLPALPAAAARGGGGGGGSSSSSGIPSSTGTAAAAAAAAAAALTVGRERAGYLAEWQGGDGDDDGDDGGGGDHDDGDNDDDEYALYEGKSAHSGDIPDGDSSELFGGASVLSAEGGATAAPVARPPPAVGAGRADWASTATVGERAAAAAAAAAAARGADPLRGSSEGAGTEEARVEVDEPPAAEEADVWTMWRAAFEGNTTKLKELIRAGGGVNEENPELEYPLHLAVAGGQAGAVAILLDNGALVDAIDGKRCTPLHAAAALGHADIAALLLASGAHPGLYDAQRRTAMAIAEAAGHTTVADVIERAFVSESCPLGCGALLEHRLVDMHTHVDCPSRLVECPKCVTEVLSSSLSEHLAAYCLLGTVPCPLLCGFDVFRFDIISHCLSACSNKDVLHTVTPPTLAEAAGWSALEFAEWALHAVLDALPTAPLPVNPKAALAASDRRARVAATAYEHRRANGGWYSDDGQYEWGTEEHAALMLIDWVLMWMADKRLSGGHIVQAAAGAFHNARRLLREGRAAGWVAASSSAADGDGDVGVRAPPRPDTTTGPGASRYVAGLSGEVAAQLARGSDMFERPFGAPPPPPSVADSSPATVVWTLHGEPAAATTPSSASATAAPLRVADEVTDALRFMLLMVGVGDAGRALLAGQLSSMLVPWLTDLYGGEGGSDDPAHRALGDALRCVPVAVTAPAGTPLRYSAAYIEQYRSRHDGADPPPLLPTHGAHDADAPPAYATDFVVIGTLRVEDGDTLASARSAVEALLFQCDVGFVQRVTKLARSAAGAEPAATNASDAAWTPAPRDAGTLRMEAQWDYLDMLRGGRRIFREAEGAASPWDVGPLVVIHVRSVCWYPAAAGAGDDAADPATFSFVPLPCPVTEPPP